MNTPARVLVGCTEKTTRTAGGGGAAVTSNVPLMAGVSPVAVARNVKSFPVRLTAMSENRATPPTALTDVVPVRLTPAGLPFSDSVTVPVNPDAVLPVESTAATCMSGVILAPTCTVLGSTVNSSVFAGGGSEDVT